MITLLRDIFKDFTNSYDFLYIIMVELSFYLGPHFHMEQLLEFLIKYMHLYNSLID